MARRLHGDRPRRAAGRAAACRSRSGSPSPPRAGGRRCSSFEGGAEGLTSQADGSKRAAGFAAQLGSLTPWRTAVISARIATAISGGVFEPMYRPDRPAQARDLGLGQVELLQALRGARRCSSSSRWRRRRTRRDLSASISARSSSFGSCVSATTALWPSRLAWRDHVVGHAALERHARNVPAAGVLLARVDHQHVVIEHVRHLGEVARQLAGADQHQAPARPVHRGEHLAVEFERVLPGPGLQRHAAAVHLQAAAHQLLLRDRLEQLAEARSSRSPAPSPAASVPPQGRPQRVASSLVTP